MLPLEMFKLSCCIYCCSVCLTGCWLAELSFTTGAKANVHGSTTLQGVTCTVPLMSDTSVVVKTTLTETKTKTRLKGAETESRPRPLNNVPLISMWRCKFNVVYPSQQHCSAEPALCRVFSLVCCFAYEFSVIKVAELWRIKKSNYRWLAILAAFEEESFTSNQNHYVEK